MNWNSSLLPPKQAELEVGSINRSSMQLVFEPAKAPMTDLMSLRTKRHGANSKRCEP